MITIKRIPVSIDFRLVTEIPVPMLIQHDTNEFVFTIKDNGVDADLSNIDRITVNFKRPDKETITKLLTATDNVIEYRLTSDEMQVAGHGEINLQLFSGDTRISSTTMKYFIESVPGATFEGNKGLNILQELFNETADLVERSQAMASFAENQANYAQLKGDYAKEAGDYAVVKTTQASELIEEVANSVDVLRGLQTDVTEIIAEEVVREASEVTRKANEITRESNESTRLDSESARGSAEAARKANESTRESNESTRESAESTRKANESTRQTKETARVNAETTRQTNESTRKANEVTRQSNETVRQTALTNMNTATTNATKATTSANTATTKANNAADNANSKASLASQRATEASEATSKANTATAQINTAKSQAEIATQEANQARDNANSAADQAYSARDSANAATVNATSAASDALGAASDIDAKADELEGRVNTAIAGGTIDLEVKDARGGEANLNVRLDKIGNQVKQSARQTQALQHGVSVVNAEANSPLDVQIEGRTLVPMQNSNLQGGKNYVLADSKTKVKAEVDGGFLQGVTKFTKEDRMSTTANFVGKV